MLDALIGIPVWLLALILLGLLILYAEISVTITCNKLSKTFRLSVSRFDITPNSNVWDFNVLHHGRFWDIGRLFWQRDTAVTLKIRTNMAKFSRKIFFVDLGSRIMPNFFFRQYEGFRPSIVVCDPKIIRECTITKFSDFPQRIVVSSLFIGWHFWLCGRWLVDFFQPFPVSPEVEKAVTTALGADWKRQRNIMTRAFSASKMRKVSLVIIMQIYSWRVWVTLCLFVWVDDFDQWLCSPILRHFTA